MKTDRVSDILTLIISVISTIMETNNIELLLDIIRLRRSHRDFSERPVPEEMAEKIIEAARWAPSSCNMQFLGLIRVEDRALRGRLVKEGKSHGTILKAPVVFVVTYEKELSQEYHSNIQSGASAIQNMMLAATAMGLGCFWAATVGKEKIVRSLLGIPNRREILALAMFGWPKEKLIAPRRREASEIVHLNAYDSSKDIPLSPNPDDWPLEQLKTFQELRLRSGARYIPYIREEFESVLAAIKKHAPQDVQTWLDLMPATGAYTEKLVQMYPGAQFSIAEIAEQMALFTAQRAGKNLPYCIYQFNGISRPLSQVVSCLFRLEAYPEALKRSTIRDISRVLLPGGTAIIGIVNKYSYFWPLYLAKAALKREFRFPTMTPNMIAPFKPVEPKEILRLAKEHGLKVKATECLFVAPTSEELSSFYSVNKTGLKQKFLQAIEACLKLILPDSFYNHFAKIHVLFLEKKL